MKQHAPVIICGAGATGSTLALLLAKRGIASIIIDRRHTPLAHPAAHVINARSLEIWREIDIALSDEIAALSPPINTVNLIRWCSSLAASPLGEIDLLSRPEQLDRVRSHSDYLISHVGQHLLMPLLWRWLEREPLIDFRRATTAHEVTQHDDHVVVRTQEDPLTGSYLVAADGANSTVRDNLDIALHGPVLAKMASAFFRAPDLHPAERPLLTWIYQPHFAGVLIAHADAHYILMGTYLSSHQPIAAQPERYWRETLPAVLGHDLSYEIVSTGTWTMTSQTATAFRRGRILLAGDAAHRFPHTGGYGLNSGVQDAHNLSWKLDAIVNDRASDTLLDTYERERRPVIERFAEHSVTNHFQLDAVTRHFGVTNRMLFRATTLMNRPLFTRLPAAVSSAMAERIVRLGLARTAVLSRDSAAARRIRARLKEDIPSQLPHFVSTGLEFGYRYNGPLFFPEHNEHDDAHTAPDDVVEYVPLAIVGGRLPHLPVITDDRRTSTLEMIDTAPNTVTLFTSDTAAWHRYLADAEPIIAPCRITTVDVGIACADPQHAISVLGLTGDAAVVARCDGHIIWRTDQPAGISSASLVSFLRSSWLPVFAADTTSPARSTGRNGR